MRVPQYHAGCGDNDFCINFFRIKKKLRPGYQPLEEKKRKSAAYLAYPTSCGNWIAGGRRQWVGHRQSDGFQAGSWQPRRIARWALSLRIRGLVLSQSEQLNYIVRVPGKNTVSIWTQEKYAGTLQLPLRVRYCAFFSFFVSTGGSVCSGFFTPVPEREFQRPSIPYSTCVQSLRGLGEKLPTRKKRGGNIPVSAYSLLSFGRWWTTPVHGQDQSGSS